MGKYITIEDEERKNPTTNRHHHCHGNAPLSALLGVVDMLSAAEHAVDRRAGARRQPLLDSTDPIALDFNQCYVVCCVNSSRDKINNIVLLHTAPSSIAIAH